MRAKRPVIHLLGAIIFVTACGKSASNQENPTTATTTINADAGSPFVGQWTSPRVSVDITRNGDTFIVDCKGRSDFVSGKFVGTQAGVGIRVNLGIGGEQIITLSQDGTLDFAGQTLHRVDPTRTANTKRRGPIDDASLRRESMEDMRSVATAWETRSTEVNTFAARDITDGTIPPEVLEATLTPTYIRIFPSEDAWGVPFTFKTGSGGKTYEIECFCASRRVVFANGSFVEY